MSSHQVIARKWRPQKFGDVVGQTHVIRTLRNAIAGNRVGHAYLLVGPRGIGKTTIARIFAKAINCENPNDGEPCCECRSCKALAAESSLDVIEIDAASRNSVEHMRSLSEEAYHMPVASKYKIYIIDEVHMLSKAAWNALLKTVEEPPAHVKFIFATTEAHLVLPTIVSRCQRFDLRPIAGNLILGRLKMIAESENVRIAPEALSAIARAAEGGMRDAQSSLEQMLAFFGGKDQEIAAEQVLELFGLTNAVELDTLIAAMLQNQPGAVVTIVNQLAGRGRNLETLFDDILEMLRGVELMHILNNPGAVLEFDDEKLARCGKLAQLANAQILRCFMENLSPVGRILHEALNKAIYLESILLKAMHEAHAPTVGDVLTRLNQLRTAGELQFIDQVPSFQTRPPVMPITLPEPPVTAPTVPAEAKSEPAVAPAPVETVAEEVTGETAVEAPAPAETVIEETVIEEAIPTAPQIEEPPVAETVPAVPQIEEPPEVQTVEPDQSNISNDPVQDLWQKLLEIGGDLKDLLQSCTPLSLENSVLSIQAPAPTAAALRENRLKMLTLLQQASGNWAILLDVQTVNEAPQLQPAEAVQAPAMPEVQLPEVPASAEATPQVPVTEMPSETTPESISTEDTFEEFIDLSAMEDLPPEEMELSRADLGYSKRSVIHDQEEVNATAKLPPVQKVLDLFGGEIVDIHA
ncbi:MAG: DNA polymerase III subunit gamma/tau [Lentisphaerae bacterium]|nr:DNA polymerase III subunit gamma/tau [Lentisphaerota bacterium]